MQVSSARLGVNGVCDVVEFHANGPVPIEYKRGRPKAHRADEVQLCAQAICLEELLDVRIPQALLFYGRNRRRYPVQLDRTLRDLTVRVADDCRELIATGRTPPADYVHRRCSACSLLAVCLPRRRREPGNIADLLKQAIETDWDE